jgi:hypothetical protein
MMSFRTLFFALVIAIAAPIGAAQALMLDTWNVDELQASDDYVDLQFGTYNGMTTITLQWSAGADPTDTVGALGIDKLFINNTSSTLEVAAVYANAIVAGNDVTGDWLPTSGGTNAGGGFGLFVEMVSEPGGNGGIDPDTLIFVLNGSYTEASFMTNASGASFAIHARYNNGCSGWAADGGTAGSSGSDSNCGGAPVPEPSAALAFGAGVLVVGSTIRRRKS